MIEARSTGRFVANVRDLRWHEDTLNAMCEFDKHRELGINLTVLRPRQPITMCHRERYQRGIPPPA
jgi:hypothetical protein